MGKKCCVPNCHSKKRDVVLSCFQFPSENDMKQTWLRAIPRTDTFNTKYLGVCILHFEVKYIQVVNEKGIPLKRPRLTEDAVPTLFSVTNDSFPDFSPEESNEVLNDDDVIRDFENFKKGLSTNVKLNDWLTLLTESSVTVFKLKVESNGNLVVHFSVNVDSDLHIHIFHNNNLLEDSFYKDITHRRQRLNLFSELNSILAKCVRISNENISDDGTIIKQLLTYALQNITDAKRIIERNTDFQFVNCVNIIHDQLIQLTQNRHRYSLNTILCAYVIYTNSSKVYELLREWGVLILPSISTLQKLTRFQDVDPSKKSSNLSYLKKIMSHLSNQEKFVIIQIDEIYSNPQVNYWNQLTGFAENSDEVATTVLGVLVSSCFGRMKEIVNLIPMKDATGQDLKRYALDVIESLQSIGLKTLILYKTIRGQ